MSTEIQRHSGGPPAAAPMDLERMAEAIVKGGMWPDIRTKEAALSLMLLCQSEGLHPVQALRRYHIIEGKPSMRADAMLAEFQRHGGRVAWHERTAEVVRATYSHPDLCPDGVEIVTTFEEFRGIATSFDKQNRPFLKKNWKHFPRQMLTARNISEGIRVVHPGVVAGIYAAEEVVDFDARDRPLAEHHDVETGEVTVFDPTRAPRSSLPEGGSPETDRLAREELNRAAAALESRWLDNWSAAYEPEPIPAGFPACPVGFHQLAGHMTKHYAGPSGLSANHRVRFLGVKLAEDRDGFLAELARYGEQELGRAIDDQWRAMQPPAAEDESQEVPEVEVVGHPASFVPRDGVELLPWVKARGEDYGVDLEAYIGKWGSLQDWPADMLKWSPEMVAAAHAEATRKLAAIDPDPPESMAEVVVRESGGDAEDAEDAEIARQAARDADPPPRARKAPARARR